jgi:intracellular sulfur oxidation DsrE/DsrF family protein
MTPHSLRALLLAALLMTWLGPVAAEGIKSSPLLETRTYLQISPDGQDDLLALFDALEASVAAGEQQPDPVVIVLHGPEARPFLRSNYLANRSMVDRAAKLKAFNRVDMRMCETWMRNNGVKPGDLQPFVDTVPLAPDEVERLERDGYLPYKEARQASSLL